MADMTLSKYSTNPCIFQVPFLNNLVSPSLSLKAVLADESTIIPVFETVALSVPVSRYVQSSHAELGWWHTKVIKAEQAPASTPRTLRAKGLLITFADLVAPHSQLDMLISLHLKAKSISFTVVNGMRVQTEEYADWTKESNDFGTIMEMDILTPTRFFSFDPLQRMLGGLEILARIALVEKKTFSSNEAFPFSQALWRKKPNMRLSMPFCSLGDRSVSGALEIEVDSL